MNNYLKNKIKASNIIIIYYINIVLLTLYGIYKNGYLLYRNNLITFSSLFKPLIILILSIGITYFIDYLFHKKKISENYNPIYISLIILTLPISINIYQLLIVIAIFDIIINIVKNDDFNIYNLMKLIIIIMIYLLGYYGYKNAYEINIDTSITSLDMFFGRSIGGIGTTNHFLMFIGYFILSTMINYKKEIPLISLLTYFIMIIIAIIFNQNVLLNINELINSEFLYGVIYIATIPNYSPITKKGRIIYSVIIGVTAFITNKLINPFEGVFIGIMLANLIMILIKKLGKSI